MANQELQKSQFKSVHGMLEKSKGQIAMALPRHMDADKMLRIALTSVRRNPKLLECTPESLIGAVIQSAQLGLYVDGILGHAYLVPYWNGKEKRREVQLIPGYKGLIDLARRSGSVDSITARVVYENDEFDFAYGLDDRLFHKPNIDEPGEPVAVYAMARLKSSDPAFEVMSVGQINTIRDKSQGYQNAIKYNGDTPWKSAWDEMARKTAIRRLVKYLPLSAELQTAGALDEVAEIGLGQGLEMALGDDDTWEVLPEPEAPGLSDVLNAFPEADQEAVTDFLNHSAKTAHVELNEIIKQAAENLDGFKSAFNTWRQKNQAGTKPKVQQGKGNNSQAKPPADPSPKNTPEPESRQTQGKQSGDLPLGPDASKSGKTTGSGNGKK